MGDAPAAPQGRVKVDLKVIFLGSSGAGKTCLIQRYINDQFSNTMSTIGASFALKSWRGYKLGLWDTAGQEKFSSLSAFYCRGAGAAIFVFDASDPTSYADLDRHYKLVRDTEPHCVMAVVAAKYDLVEADASAREAALKFGQSWADDKGAPFFITSAKTGMHVTEVFESVAAKALGVDAASPRPSAPVSPDTIKLDTSTPSAAPAQDGACGC
eukprot:Opistho-1_new@75803